LPMPRLAPVTSAILLFSDVSVMPAAMLPHFSRIGRRFSLDSPKAAGARLPDQRHSE